MSSDVVWSGQKNLLAIFNLAHCFTSHFSKFEYFRIDLLIFLGKQTKRLLSVRVTT